VDEGYFSRIFNKQYAINNKSFLEQVRERIDPFLSKNLSVSKKAMFESLRIKEFLLNLRLGLAYIKKTLF